MESVYDLVNAVNSGDLHSLLKAAFLLEGGENVRKAADFIERALCVAERCESAIIF